jgi:signal transduction histidine kinase
MSGSVASNRKVLAVVRAIAILAGLSFAFFLVGFLVTVFGFDDTIPPTGLFMGTGVLFSSCLLILSFWLLAALDNGRGMASYRGSELVTPRMQACPDPILQLDDSLRIVSMNRAAERRFGRMLSAASGMPLNFLLPELKGKAPTPEVTAPMKRADELRDAKAFLGEETQTSSRRLALRAGTRLSHLVQPLLGYTELAMEALEPGHPVRADLAEIGRASSRVVLLARSLEVFGGGRGPDVERVELNSFLAGLEPDLHFVLQPETRVQLTATRNPVWSAADPGLTRLALLLLACNAEEAMPPGGKVSISVAGDGSGFQVADTGEGVPKEVRVNMFRPLTSTKDPERGVGLGLYTARAVMRLQHGDLTLTQSGETGSVISLLLPVSEEQGSGSETNSGSDVTVSV